MEVAGEAIPPQPKPPAGDVSVSRSYAMFYGHGRFLPAHSRVAGIDCTKATRRPAISSWRELDPDRRFALIEQRLAYAGTATA